MKKKPIKGKRGKRPLKKNKKQSRPFPFERAMFLFMAATAAVIALALFSEIKPYLSEEQGQAVVSIEVPAIAVAPIPAKKEAQPNAEKREPAPEEKPQKRLMAAIIIDDLGVSSRRVTKLLELGLPITFSILPGEPHSKAIAERVASAGHEVMLHLPMEPEDREHNNPGRSALMVSQSEMEIRRMVKRFIAETPHIAGVNNHMGSLFTKNEYLMRIVMEEIKKAGIFFIDSYTVPGSVGRKIARKVGVKTASRNFFIDNDRDVEKIKEVLREAVRLSARNGGVIAIGHPYPETTAAIAQMKEEFKAAGVELVYASRLVR